MLAALVDARLLTVSEGAVELSHEALLREWPRYRAWLEEDRVGRRLHSHLSGAAAEWERPEPRRRRAVPRRPADRRARLDRTAPRPLNRSEREFIDCSQTEADREARRSDPTTAVCAVCSSGRGSC